MKEVLEMVPKAYKIYKKWKGRNDHTKVANGCEEITNWYIKNGS
jgi:hypothetical protein